MRDDMARRPAGVTVEPDHRAGAPTAADEPAPPAVSLLALQFLAWVAARPRTHADVMDAWRSTCPRQSVWEDTLGDGLVAFEPGTKGVVLTPRGRSVLEAGHPG